MLSAMGFQTIGLCIVHAHSTNRSSATSSAGCTTLTRRTKRRRNLRLPPSASFLLLLLLLLLQALISPGSHLTQKIISGIQKNRKGEWPPSTKIRRGAAIIRQWLESLEQ